MTYAVWKCSPELPGSSCRSTSGDQTVSDPHRMPHDPPVSKKKQIFSHSSASPETQSVPHSDLLDTVAGLLVEGRERVVFPDGEESQVGRHTDERVCHMLVGPRHLVTHSRRVFQSGSNKGKAWRGAVYYNNVTWYKLRLRM